MNGLEKCKALFEDYAHPWEGTYDYLSQGHNAVLRYHLAYNLDIYPDYFYLEDASMSTLVSKGMKITSDYDWQSKTFTKKVVLMHDEKELTIIKSSWANSKKQAQIKNKWGIGLLNSEYEIVNNVLEQKLSKTRPMLVSLKDMYRKKIEDNDELIKNFIKHFKSSPMHLILMIIFLEDAQKVRLVTQYLVNNEPELLSMFDNYDKLKDSFIDSFKLKKLVVKREEYERAKSAFLMLEDEIRKQWTNLDVMNDAYLLIRLNKALSEKPTTIRTKI